MQLRRLEQKDAEYMLEWMHNESVVRHLSADFAKKEIEDCKNFIATSLEDKCNLNLAIIDEADTYMGTASLKHIDMKEKTAEFAITVRQCAMGKGYSAYGMKELLRIGLEELNLTKIVWCVSIENKRAIRFYDKNGYQRITDVPEKYKTYYSEEQLETFIWYMVKKKVSIIVPVYNAERNIQLCISRIQKQTYGDIEIICVNDGSRDKSKEILEELAQTDSRLIVVNKENGGVSSARNKGIEMATGHYIQFVDSDDLIDENMTEILVDALEENATQMAICGYRFSNAQKARVPESSVLERQDFLEKFYSLYVGGFICSPWNKLFIKKYITETFPEDMNLGEDAVFNMNYIANISTICMVSASPYLYEVGNANSLSWHYNEKALYCEEIKNKRILHFLQDANLDQQKNIMREFLNDFKRCIDSEILSGKYSQTSMQERVYQYVMNPFWHEILVKTGVLGNVSNQELHSSIQHYIRRMTLVRYKSVVKRFLKKTIKGSVS